MKAITLIGIGITIADIIKTKGTKKINFVELFCEGMTLLFPEKKIFKSLKFTAKAFCGLFS